MVGRKEVLQTMLEKWKELSEAKEVVINKKKMKVVALGEEENDLNIDLQANTTEQVHDFEYQGVTMQGKGK